MNTLGIQRIGSGLLELSHFEVMFLDMLAEDVDGVHGHRAVEVHGEDRDFVLLFELAQDVEQLLRATYRKRRNDNRSPSLSRRRDDLCQLGFGILAVLVAVQAIAVCGFHYEVVGSIDRRRVEDNRLIVSTDIAGKQNALLAASRLFFEENKRR